MPSTGIEFVRLNCLREFTFLKCNLIHVHFRVREGVGGQFDGRGGTLDFSRRTVTDVMLQPIIEMYFDNDVPWIIDNLTTNGKVDFYSIALHEIGHAIGHSDHPSAVMYGCRVGSTSICKLGFYILDTRWALSGDDENPARYLFPQ